MKSNTGLLCIEIGLVLIAAAAGLFFFNLFESGKARKSAGGVLRTMQQEIGEARDDESNEVLNASNEQDMQNPEEQNEMPVVEIDGYEYIGYLSIPVLELELPIMSEWDYPKLKIAPCRQYGSTYSGDLVIAGHNYSSHFGRLQNLSIGDAVIFSDANGIEWNYCVKEIEVLEPTQVEEMKNSPWELTLYTCTLGGAHRVTVRCARAE